MVHAPKISSLKQSQRNIKHIPYKVSKGKIWTDFDNKIVFCQNDTETLIDLFWSCNCVQKHDGSFISNTILNFF